MKPEAAKSPPQSYFLETLFLQAVIMVLAGMVLDGGHIFQVCAFAQAAFWVGGLVNVARRKGEPTKMDILLFRVGFLPLCILSYFLTGWIWKLRGHDVLLRHIFE